ncbi:MAG: c-type cytochrome domain-containing protein [Sphingomonadaceae bacterium]
MSMRYPKAAATTALGVLLVLASLAAAGCGAAQPSAAAANPTAAPAAGKVVWAGSYAQHIQPIFDQRCVSCHGPTKADNGLRLDSYDGVMKGTQHGPVVAPGSPNNSALISVLKGTADPSIRMPHGGQRLTEQDLQNLTLWIEAGAKNQ